MTKQTPTISLAVLALLLLTQFAHAMFEPPVDVWPLPQRVTKDPKHPKKRVRLAHSSEFQILHNVPESVASKPLEIAIAMHTELIFRQLPAVPSHGWMQQTVAEVSRAELSRLPVLSTVTVVVRYPDVALGFMEGGGAEAHSVEVVDNGDGTASAVVEAFTVWGALHGLWTFTQLVDPSVVAPDAVAFLAPVVEIDDWPRFPWRGFLLDTSRHFIHPNTIKHIIDGLAMCRLNVLHWHLVDSHSFPVDLPSNPELAIKGSWGGFYKFKPSGLPSTVYSQEDVQEIITYAALRGVRVMPEIDTPAHITAWGKANPGFIACEDLHFAAHAIDPTKEENIKLVEKVLKDVADMFPDRFLHIGADEMNFDCWKNGQGVRVQQWADKKKLTLDDVHRQFEERIIPFVESLGRTVVAYADPLARGIAMPKSSILQVWVVDGAVDLIRRVVRSNHRVIISAGWYLDMQVPSLSRKQRYSFEETWRDFYMNDPIANARLTQQELGLVLGGEISLWAEQVDDTNIITKAFPRTAAAAERLWSSPNCDVHCVDTDETQARLMNFRCLMVLLGVRSGPVTPDFCPHVLVPPLLDHFHHRHSRAMNAVVDVVEVVVDRVESAFTGLHLAMMVFCVAGLVILVRVLKLRVLFTSATKQK